MKNKICLSKLDLSSFFMHPSDGVCILIKKKDNAHISYFSLDQKKELTDVDSLLVEPLKFELHAILKKGY